MLLWEVCLLVYKKTMDNIIDLIVSETNKDRRLYCDGKLSREDMNANLIERRKILLMLK